MIVQPRLYPAEIPNEALRALSPAAFGVLKPHLTQAAYREGVTLWDVHDELGAAYFPLTGLVSVVMPTDVGVGIEVGNVGREAVIAANFSANERANLTKGVVTVGGSFLRMSVAELCAAAERNEQVRQLVRLSEQWMLHQAQQRAVCNTVHPADRRFCRWILECSEKLRTKQVSSTQEAIALLLGLRRTTVSLVAHSVQSSGAIRYSRGHISLMDEPLLLSTCCGCHTALGRSHWPSTRLLGAREFEALGLEPTVQPIG